MAIKSKAAADLFGASRKLPAKVLKHSNEYGWEDRGKKKRDPIEKTISEKNHRFLQ